MALEEEQPFFHRESVKRQIADLADAHRLIVYAGAGVTIDRSSLDWYSLVRGLLEPYVPDASERFELVANQPAVFSGSVASQLYINDHGDRAPARMTDRLRVLLYNSGDWQKGRLATSIARLVLGTNLRQIDRHIPGLGSAVVTPNYDSYVWEELREATLQAKGYPRSQAQRLFPTVRDPLDPSVDRDLLRSWVARVDQPSPEHSACSHLHGFIPRDEMSRALRYPVVSERDYLRTADISWRVLSKLFYDTTVLLVGASMADAPLLRALYDTRETRHRRYALVPSISDRDLREKATLNRRLAERYRHFGVTPIFTDYYSQVDQFIREIQVAGALEAPLSYADAGQTERYGARLSRWWDQWSGLIQEQYSTYQGLFHELLALLRETVRATLEAAYQETFKLELWVRWNPESNRQMNLWASSTGSWSDVSSMRVAAIRAESDYKSIGAFTTGRPVYSSLATDELPHQRWRTYLSVPIYLSSDESRTNEFAVGAITVASMSDKEDSSLSPSANRARLTELVTMLRNNGETLLIPDESGWYDLYDALTDR